MRFAVIILLIFLFFSCSNDDKKISENGYAVSDTLLAWETNADSMIMKRDAAVPDSAITIRRIINGLNEKYPEIQIDVIKQSGDTIYIAVPDGEYLGNQMGSAGSSAWFADAVINLTSVPGINYVSFKMDMYSHASSGVISQEEYKGWKRE
ncbi:MAG TPA: hypothetical protein VFH07_07530 [Chitinophagaceae bacterium]|jgi:hypothetical protein|nr:hypothetical protein [Chitinophagaceae bacterium]